MNTVRSTAINERFIRAKAAAAELPAPLAEDEREALMGRIERLLIEQDAVLVAHYYVDRDLQELAERTGGHVSDSLDMARFGHEHRAKTLVVAGVRFMGETAKILNPEKRVIMPELEAECSLDLGCDPEEFAAFCDAHPDRTVVVYANTSAKVKARADWMVTSSIALDVVEHLHRQGRKILWAPDRHLGAYIEKMTGADMLLWNGSCIVHDEFRAQELAGLKARFPQAAVLVHPESPASVIAIADVVGSTSALVKAARDLPADTLIVATDRGILYKMKQAAPGKRFLEAPTQGAGASCRSCGHCPWMAMNGLRRVAEVLKTGANEIFVDEPVRARAALSIKRMLDFARQRLDVDVRGRGQA